MLLGINFLQLCKRNVIMLLMMSMLIFIQQSLERQRTAEKERLFLVYAKQWWKEFLEIRPSHKSKMVKIFAQVCLHSHGITNKKEKDRDSYAVFSVAQSHISQQFGSWWVLNWNPVLYLAPCAFCRMRMASIDQCAPMFGSCGRDACWRALDRRLASSACWPKRRPQWWEEEGSRSSGAL